MAEHCFSVTLKRGGSVAAIVDVPDEYKAHRTPVVALGHGAGAGMRHDFMEFFATALAERGMGVVRFNFPYMERAIGGGRRPPDPMGVLLDCYREVIVASSKRTGSPPGPLFVGGKSLGARVASLLVAKGVVKPSGLVYLGYPLHAAGKTDDLHSNHLAASRAPMLFVQGENDPLCRLDLLREERKRLRLSGSLHVVPRGGHSFELPAGDRHRQGEEMNRAADVVRAFVKHVLKKR